MNTRQRGLHCHFCVPNGDDKPGRVIATCDKPRVNKPGQYAVCSAPMCEDHIEEAPQENYHLCAPCAKRTREVAGG